jgi:hypothetical protein
VQLVQFQTEDDSAENGYALEMAKAQEIVSEIHPMSRSSSAGLDGIGALILGRDEVRVEMRLDKGSGWSLSEIGKSSEDRFPNSLGTARGSPAAVSVRGLKY